MPIDPYIARGVQPPQIESPLNMMAQMYQLKNAQQTGRLNALSLQEAEQTATDRNALRSLNLSDPAVRARLPQYGAPGMAMAKAFQEQETAGISAKKTKLDLYKLALDQSREGLVGVDTPEAFVAWHEGNHRNPILVEMYKDLGLNKAEADQRVAQAMSQPGGFQRLKMESLMGAQKTAEFLQKQQETKVVGGAMVQMSPDGKVRELYRAPEKADKPTSEIQEYNLAKQQGFTGTFMDFKQANKGKGFTVTTADGTVVQMGGGADSGLAKPTINKLEEDIVKSQAALDRMRAISQSFDPDYLLLQNQTGAAWAGAKDKIGISSPADKDKVKKYEEFASGVVENLNLTIKELTGAAMGVQEAERIMSTAPNLKDGPTAFKSKLDRTQEALTRVMARSYYTRQNGLSMDAVPLDRMDKIVDEYGDKLEKQIAAQNPGMPQAEVDRLALEQTRRNFGM